MAGLPRDKSIGSKTQRGRRDFSAGHPAKVRPVGKIFISRRDRRARRQPCQKRDPDLNAEGRKKSRGQRIGTRQRSLYTPPMTRLCQAHDALAAAVPHRSLNQPAPREGEVIGQHRQQRQSNQKLTIQACDIDGPQGAQSNAPRSEKLCFRQVPHGRTFPMRNYTPLRYRRLVLAIRAPVAIPVKGTKTLRSPLGVPSHPMIVAYGLFHRSCSEKLSLLYWPCT
jgi:hypothetical protein